MNKRGQGVQHRVQSLALSQEGLLGLTPFQGIPNRLGQHFIIDAALNQVILGPLADRRQTQILVGQTRQHHDRQVGRLFY